MNALSDTSGGKRTEEGLTAEEERRLIEASGAGDETAFEQLVQAHENQIFALAYQMLHDADEAQDVTQEVFLNCFRNLGSFRFESRLATWLYRVTTNAVKNRWKYHHRRQREHHLSLDEAVDDGPSLADRIADPGRSPLQRAEDREMTQLVRHRMAELQDEHREVLILRFSRGLSYEEIAGVLGCSLGTVKSRINRARGHLREAMRDVL